LGNDAFLAKNYEEAIKHYSDSIQTDPDNAVYYSNRRLAILNFRFLKSLNFVYFSACYASLKNWQLSLEDALVCISKDHKFVKGYYRLSSAQTELGSYDDAETTLRAALALEPGFVQ
jgi:tetratricopeptide (TPR) repeat protein